MPSQGGLRLSIGVLLNERSSASQAEMRRRGATVADDEKGHSVPGAGVDGVAELMTSKDVVVTIRR